MKYKNEILVLEISNFLQKFGESYILVVAWPASTTQEGAILCVMLSVTWKVWQLTRLLGERIKKLHRCRIQ